MKQLICDVCKKVIVDPVATWNYFHVADIDICEPCRDDLQLALKPTMRGKAPFDFAWSDELTLKLLRDGMQKGRIDTKPRR